MPWLTGWTHRKKITIQHANVDALLADFPLYVGFSGDADFAGALATGYDVRFTQADGQSLLCYERESWAGGGGSAVTADFWVKVPSISAVADTDIYVYWGKAGAADGQDAASVWDADFQAVYHLHDDFLDSTSHNRDLTNYGSTDAAGKVGDCQSFDGTAYCLDGTGPTGSGDWTLEAVVSPGSAQDSTNLFTVIGKCSGGGANGFYLARYQGDCRLQVHGAPGTAYSQTSAQCSEQAWHHLTGTYDYSTGACQTFVDGAEDTNSTAAAGIAIGTDYGLSNTSAD
jgi:hypothetical protein